MSLLSILGFFLIVLIFTHGLFGNFFEQDEWGAFGYAINGYNLPWWNMFIDHGFHFSPLGYIYWLIFYILFGFKAAYYTFAQLLLHSIAAYLVYVLSSKLSKNKTVGILTSILFVTNGRANQAFTHLAIFNMVASFIFIISFLIYLANIKGQLFSKKNLVVLYLFFLGAVGFREEGFMIVPLFLSYLYIYDRKKINKKNFGAFIYLGLGLILLIGYWFLAKFLNSTSIPASVKPSYKDAFYNFLALPIKLISQTFITSNSILFFLVDNTKKIYRDASINVSENYPPLIDLVDLIIFNLLAIPFSLWVIFSKNKDLLKHLSFCILFILFDVFITSFLGRSLYLIDQRYLYFVSFPILFLTSFFFVSVFTSKSKKSYIDLLKKICVFVVLIFLITTSYQDIQRDVSAKKIVGEAKVSLLKSIVDTHPKLSDKTIFFFECREECSRNAKFGLPNNVVLPFQLGPGWVLLATYSKGHETTWGKFMSDDFLINYGSQGYREIGNMGFGYFIDRDMLIKTLKQKKLSSDVVVALQYNEDSLTVSDISKSFRESLK